MSKVSEGLPLNERIAVLEVKVEGLEAKLSNMDNKLDDVLTLISTGKGFWKAVGFGGSIVIGVGAFIGWVIHTILTYYQPISNVKP